MFKRKKHATFEAHIPLTQLFKKADGATKASYLIMGAANIANKQYLKGFIFLALEIILGDVVVHDRIKRLSQHDHVGHKCTRFGL